MRRRDGQISTQQGSCFVKERKVISLPRVPKSRSNISEEVASEILDIVPVLGIRAGWPGVGITIHQICVSGRGHRIPLTEFGRAKCLGNTGVSNRPTFNREDPLLLMEDMEVRRRTSRGTILHHDWTISCEENLGNLGGTLRKPRKINTNSNYDSNISNNSKSDNNNDNDNKL